VTRIVAITNEKGGVAKTTTAVNLAACLALAERSVLLVDLDNQGNATSSLGHERHASRAGAPEVLLGEVGARQATVATEVPGLDLLPSSRELAGVDIDLFSNLERPQFALREARLDRLGYDYVLIDTPPSLGLIPVNALTAADAALIPQQTEYLALEGLGDMLGTIRKIRASLNPRLVIDGIVLTLFDTRTRLHHQVAQDVRRNLPEQVFDTVIPVNVRVAEAPSFGKPVPLYDIDSRGARAYLALAAEYLMHTEGPGLSSTGVWA
jgi:chromosome partitioning protein